MTRACVPAYDRLTPRGQRLAAALALTAIAAVLLLAFLTGQSRQTRWCQTHPTAAATAEACTNGPTR